MTADDAAATPDHSGSDAERDLVLRQWWRKAGNDLRAAEHTLTIEEDCPFDAVGFPAQQCAEKSLKALLVLHSRDVPRTHDLRRLVRLVGEAGVDVGVIDALDLDLLTDYAVAGRYADDFEPGSREEAEAAVEMARTVRDVAGAMLPPGVV